MGSEKYNCGLHTPHTTVAPGPSAQARIGALLERLGRLEDRVWHLERPVDQPCPPDETPAGCVDVEAQQQRSEWTHYLAHPLRMVFATSSGSIEDFKVEDGRFDIPVEVEVNYNTVDIEVEVDTETFVDAGMELEEVTVSMQLAETLDMLSAHIACVSKPDEYAKFLSGQLKERVAARTALLSDAASMHGGGA